MTEINYDENGKIILLQKNGKEKIPKWIKKLVNFANKGE
jgi:hypothetical protein